MIKLVIPTRNRHLSLKALFRYLEKFYPNTSLIIADGSDTDRKEAIRTICNNHGKNLSIELKEYPVELPFFERILDAIQSCDDDYISMGADDDYPLIDVLESAKNSLIHNNERYTSIVPCDVVLTLRKNGHLTSRLSHSRDVLNKTPIDRVKDYSYWHFATSYGVTKKQTLLERYRMMSKYNCASFIDFQIGVEDAIHGGIKAIPEIGCIRTQTYEHEYFRATDSLVFLRKSEKILSYRDYLTEKFSDLGDHSLEGSPRNTARKLADLVVSRRIADLTGASAPGKSSFNKSKQFRNPTLQKQYKNFYDLHKADTEVRDQHIAKLRYARDVLFSDVARTENTGPINNYENI